MRRFNKGEWIWFILLIGWALYLLHLLTKGSIVSFIHPKRIPIMWGTLVGILILAFYQSTKLFTIPSRKAVFYSYLPMGIVLLCGVLILTAKETDRISSAKPQMVLTQGVNSGGSKEVMSSSADKSEDIASDEVMSEAIMPEDEIVLNDENYTQVLSEIEQNSNQYIGKRITLEGFVYRDETFDKDEFVVARMFMVCCAADAQITGLMATWDKSSTLKDEQWVRIEGILKSQTYTLEGQESTIPIIHIVSATKLKTPENQYVYY